MESLTLTFIHDLLAIVAEFLMLEPICYFTGIFILCAVVALVNRICKMW